MEVEKNSALLVPLPDGTPPRSPRLMPQSPDEVADLRDRTLSQVTAPSLRLSLADHDTPWFHADFGPLGEPTQPITLDTVWDSSQDGENDYYGLNSDYRVHHPSSCLGSSTSSLAADRESQDSDLATEQRCISEAKQLMLDALANCPHVVRYQICSLLGFGTFGIVIGAIDRTNGIRVALKIMKKSQIHPSRLCKDPQTGQDCVMEIVLLKYAPRHKNIIEFVEAWQDNDHWFLVTHCAGHSWTREPLDPMTRLPLSVSALLLPYRHFPPKKCVNMLVQQYPSHVFVVKSEVADMQHRIEIATKGNDQSLAALLRSCGGLGTKPSQLIRRPILPEPLQKHIFIQVCDAVAALHAVGMAHRDLKDENILVDSSLDTKLIDFGHAAFYYSPDLHPEARAFKNYGTPIFSAPELRSGLTCLGPEADIYALGLVLYEMTFGDLPVNFDQAYYVKDGSTVFEVSDRLGFGSELLRDLVRAMLNPDPAHRPTIEEVLSHPWFQTM